MKYFMREQLTSLVIELSSPACNGYLKRPLPCELDDCVSIMLDAYVNGSASVKSEIMKVIGPEQSFGLLAFAERMAILSVREKSCERLEKALLALIVEAFRWDARENMLILSLINHSAIKIGADPKQFFEVAAKHASTDITQHLRKFIKRRTEDKSIQIMGYSEEMTADGFSYIRHW